jgi:hypothetical protein
MGWLLNFPPSSFAFAAYCYSDVDSACWPFKGVLLLLVVIAWQGFPSLS